MAAAEAGSAFCGVADGTLQVVTMRRLEGALACVRRELEVQGFWTKRLADVDVYLVPVGLAYGWHVAHEPGVICIPAVSACRLGDLLHGRKTSLRDVLRHEHGHALANCHRGLLRSREFTRAFGRAHSSPEAEPFEPDAHLTEYAATAAAEDFAETFMAYVRHRGRWSEGGQRPALKRKWTFIHDLQNAIRRGQGRW